MPDLVGLCVTLVQSGAEVVVVDNTDVSYIRDALLGIDCTVIEMASNLGIAHGQNEGVRHALSMGGEVIVFFDQDSKIDGDFLHHLLGGMDRQKPCVRSPIFFDEAKGYEYPALRLNSANYPVKVFSHAAAGCYPVDVVISSGSVVTAAAFEAVGLFDEAFFIDYVDTEWCIRARAKRVPIEVNPAAVMRHSIGQASVNLGVIRGHIHNPNRSYYKLRNCFLLLRRKHVPLVFAVRELLISLIHSVILLFWVEHKVAYTRALALALLDGVRGTSGKRCIA